MRAWDYPGEIVVVRCRRCAREGRYRKARFVELVGKDTQLPTALGIIAKNCPRANKPGYILHDRCEANYPELAEKQNRRGNH